MQASQIALRIRQKVKWRLGKWGAGLISIAVLSACTQVRTQPENIPAAASANGLSNGELNYGVRCKGCHEPATPGAPSRKMLAEWQPQKIVTALVSGKMREFSPALTPIEIREIAVFLTGKPLPKQGKLPAATPTPSLTGSP